MNLSTLKFKTSVCQRHHFKNEKTGYTQKNIFETHISNKEIVLKIYNILRVSKINTKLTDNPIEKML